MRLDKDSLARLLPALHHIRDAQRAGGKRPLAELVQLLAEQVQVLEENLEQLYDDEFIETCDDWVVPYIGDLLGCRNLDGRVPGAAAGRAEVANTVAYRRRKGTASMLEKLARDVTGWESRVVEFFTRLATTQYVNHVRPESLATASLRRASDADDLSTAFERFTHLGEVRSVVTRRGKYSIPHVGIFVWRLEPFSVTQSPATPAAAGDRRRYFFSQLGHDVPLLTRPRSEQDISHLADPVNVPMRIRRRRLHADPGDYYGEGRSILVEGAADAGDIVVCNLSDRGAADWGPGPAAGKVAIDPELGRLLFAADQGAPPRVTFHHAFPAEMGGGEYDRRSSLAAAEGTIIVRVPSEQPSLLAAIGAIAGRDGIVEITDNGRYVEPLAIALSANQKLEVRAANERRPHLALEAPFTVDGDGAEVTFNGLLVSGKKVQVGGGMRACRFRHCTLVPGLSLTAAGLASASGSHALEVDGAAEVEVDRSVIGSVRLHEDAVLRVSGSILDCTSFDGVAVAGRNGAAAAGILSIVRSTVIGEVRAAFLELGCNSIFCLRVTSSRRQGGCVRFSYLPWESRAPRRHRCQPSAAGENRVRPVFTAYHFGQPGYCQLAASCCPRIREGADDGSEMGVFHDLYQPQRERNLRVRLEEYLRVGLEAGVFYAS